MWIGILFIWLALSATAFDDKDAIYSLNWQEFKHEPAPDDYETVLMRTHDKELYECRIPTKVLEKYNASDSFAVDRAALNAARWLLLPLLNMEAPIEESDATCWQLLSTASLPGQFWRRRAAVVYELCSIGDGGYVKLYKQEGGDAWNLGGLPDIGVDEIAAALRPGPTGSFVELDNNQRSAFVELTLDYGGESCTGDVYSHTNESASWRNLSTILRFACGRQPGLVSATQLGPCQHRLLMLTPLLCSNSAFRPRPARVNHIACRREWPLNGAARSGRVSGPPRSLAQLESSRDNGRLVDLLLRSGKSSTTKLRISAGDGPAETVLFVHSGLPGIFEDDANEDDFF